MNKITKKLFIISMMVLASLFIVSCGESSTTSQETTTEDDIRPTVTEDPQNPGFTMDTVYFEGDGYEVTYGDLYDSILVNDGIDQLVELVDRQLLADYISQVTQEDIDAKREELIYGTKDQEIIDDLDDDQVVKMQQSYLDGMTVLGFSQDDTKYIELLVARDLYVFDLLTDPSFEDSSYITPEDIADEYVKNRVGEVNSIVIRFDTQTEAVNMLESNNLVEMDQEIKLYTGTTPLNQVPAYNLNEDNTRSLTTQELLSYFIQFYNDVYDTQKDPLDVNATVTDLVELDDLTYDYDTLVETSSALAGLVFDTLSTLNDPEEIAFYTYRPFKINLSNGSDYYLVMNLDKTHLDLTDFDGDEAALISLIGQDIYNDIMQDLIATNLEGSRFVAGKMQDYREENGFEIYDYYLKLDYESVVPEDMEVTHLNQLTDVIASFDGQFISVKDLMTFALERKAPLYLVHAAQFDILRSTHYDDIYCDDDGNCETDWTQNNSGAMNTHLSEYTTLKESFTGSQVSMLYTFEEALYVYYGVRSEDEMINGYVDRTIEPLLIYDYIKANADDVVAKMMPYITDYYDNFFSLDTRHILIYLDENGDGSPDDYEEYYNALEDTTAFDALLVDFETDIRQYLADNDDNLSDFVTLYNAADREDEDWGVYKKAGLKVLTENLSSTQSLNYTDVYLNYETPFVEGLTALYQTYKLDENANKPFMYSDGLVETSYGLHLIKAEKGEYFDLDSAAFTVPEDTTYNYPEGLNNTEERLSASQIKVYFDYEVFTIVSSVVDLEEIYDFEKPDIPDRIEGLLELFVKDLYDAHYASAYLNMSIIDILTSGTLVDDSVYSYFTETEIEAYFDMLSEVYENQVYNSFE